MLRARRKKWRATNTGTGCCAIFLSLSLSIQDGEEITQRSFCSFTAIYA